MKLDEHCMRLIAVGASVAANCQTCLETNLARARECGANEDELSQAVWVGRMIRKGAASHLDALAQKLVEQVPASTVSEDCGCHE